MALINIVDNLTSTSATDALSANQGRVLKELIDAIPTSSTEEKNIMTVKLEDSFYEEAGSSYKVVPMVLYNSTGNKLSLSNNGVVIGTGVSKVLVSSNVKVIAAGGIGNKHSRIYKNDTTVCWTNTKALEVSDEITINNTPILLDVTNGDIITLKYFILTGDRLSGGAYTPTYLTVEVVE